MNFCGSASWLLVAVYDQTFHRSVIAHERVLSINSNGAAYRKHIVPGRPQSMWVPVVRRAPLALLQLQSVMTRTVMTSTMTLTLAKLQSTPCNLPIDARGFEFDRFDDFPLQNPDQAG